MNTPLRISWTILIISSLFLILGIASFVILYLMSLASLSTTVAEISKSISQVDQLQALKDACIRLATITEEDRISRLYYLLWGLGTGASLALISVLLSAWQIIATNKINKSS
ncbi:MAG: hypothetical protein NDI93_16095 [Pseudomonas sp.]|nr:hypothetical protein [Pseudomonas sp.]